MLKIEKQLGVAVLAFSATMFLIAMFPSMGFKFGVLFFIGCFIWIAID